MIGLCATFLTGCSAAAWKGVAAGLAAGSQYQQPPEQVQPPRPGQPPLGPTKLMLFGGSGHNTYLGCLNCPDTAPDSVFNTYGEHGNEYSQASIFNRYSDFGSGYSQYSACNKYAQDPPVIVDSAGQFYGRLTINQYGSQATSDVQIRAWLAGVCQAR